jgi:3-hydroxybutyryl-CoA dehydrogenase
VGTFGVVGAGVMGGGIAQVAAIGGYDTICVDIDPAAVERARKSTRTGRYGLDRAVEIGKLTAEQAEAAAAHLTYGTDLKLLAGCEVIVEAITERFDVKAVVFKQLDEISRPDAILATNTSGFSVEAIAAVTAHPERVVGWHWASPAPVMRFAEVVRAPGTDARIVDEVVAIARALGKNPIVVNDSHMVWGFVANRALGALRRECERIVAEGVATDDQVDQLLVDCFRWPVGPFTLRRGAQSGWS